MTIRESCDQFCPRVEAIRAQEVVSFVQRVEAATGKEVTSYGSNAGRSRSLPPEHVSLRHGGSADERIVGSAWSAERSDLRRKAEALEALTANCPGMLEATVVVNEIPVAIQVCGKTALEAAEAATISPATVDMVVESIQNGEFSDHLQALAQQYEGGEPSS